MHGQLCCVRYIAVYRDYFLFLPFTFLEVETASEMTKTTLYLFTLVNISMN